MLLKVKHSELNNVSNTIKTDSEAIDVEIEKMQKEIDKLKGIWQGDDADTFCENVSAYLTKMKNIPVAMRNMNKVISAANKGYEENDEAFGNALKVEAENYEE